MLRVLRIVRRQFFRAPLKGLSVSPPIPSPLTMKRTMRVPSNAKQVDLKDVQDKLRDLPENFKMGAAK